MVGSSWVPCMKNSPGELKVDVYIIFSSWNWKYWICMWLCEWVWHTWQQIGKLLNFSSRPSISPCQQQFQTTPSNWISILVPFLDLINQKIHIWIAFPRSGQPHITFPCMGGQEVGRERYARKKFQEKFGPQLHCQLHAPPLNPL